MNTGRSDWLGRLQWPVIALSAMVVSLIGIQHSIVLVGLVGVAAAWMWPGPTLLAVCSTAFLSLPVLLIARDTGSLTAAQYGLLAVVAASSFVRSSAAARVAWLRVSWPILVAAGLGFIVAVSNHVAHTQVAVGVLLLILPVTGLLVGPVIGPGTRRVLPWLMVVLLGVNAVVALWEVRTGVELLPRYGLEYGTTIRTIGETLRAPGLTLTNFQLSLLAAAVVSAALTDRVSRHRRFPGASFWLILVFGTGDLILSTTRTGLIIVVVTAVFTAMVMLFRRGGRGRLVGVVVALGAVLAFVWRGADTTASLSERIQLWGTILHQGVTVLGHGIGTAGAATGSSYATSSVLVADNYYLSVLWQIGLAGLTLFVWFLVAAVFRRSTGGRPWLWSAAPTLALVLSMFTLETWDYTVPTLLMFLFMRLTASQATMNDDDVEEDEPDRSVSGVVAGTLT
jgi:hypothetical protein